MTDYSELIKALTCGNDGKLPCHNNECPYWVDKWHGIGLCNVIKKDADAADAIEALQAEQKKTVTQIFGEEQQKWTEYCTALGNRIKELEQQMPKRGEIVRCGECKWYQPDLCANPWGVCFHEDWVENNIGHTVDEDGFCYRGEREVQE